METYANYGFNKSHAVAYATIGYATAFLKAYYPLEWWASVLSNAKKEKIVDKLWGDCYKFVKMPDINMSNDRFEIEGDFIRAPISLLTGIGQAAHDAICSFRPYKDIKDFCEKIHNSKLKNAETKGRKYTPVHSGIVNKLIVSGVMDSLFEPGLSTIEKLMEYNKTVAAVAGKKVAAVDEKYENLNPFKLHLTKKSILPIFSEELMEPMIQNKKSHIEISQTGKNYFKFANDYYRILDSQQFVDLDEKSKEIFPNEPIRVCMVGYACDSLKFNYHGNKQAYKMDLDVNGERFNFVKWPDKRGLLKGIPNTDINNSIVILLLSKFNQDRPFVINEVFELEKALEE
jgi:DNA polymerase III alpha subunit